MIQRLRQSWRELKNDPPGRRFQERYRRRHGQGTNALRKLLFIGGGILVMAAGVFFLAAPGPGIVILVIGAGLVAQESLLAARALDWSEIRARRAGGWGARVWKGASIPVKIALVLIGAIAATGMAYVAYRVMFAH